MRHHAVKLNNGIKRPTVHRDLPGPVDANGGYSRDSVLV